VPSILRPRLLSLPQRFETDKLVLRAYREGDGAAFFAAVDEGRGDLSQWLSWVGQRPTIDDSEASVRSNAGKWITRESLILGIFSKDEKTLYGGTGFHGFDWNVPSCEIGWFLRKSARGQGIAADAVRLCCKLAFEHIGAARVWGSVNALNERSWRLFERVGFKREPHLRADRRDHHGELRDTFIYSMLAHEWQSSGANTQLTRFA
jgi:RimJ/RimL family protein N-acetyltransferase